MSSTVGSSSKLGQRRAATSVLLGGPSRGRGGSTVDAKLMKDGVFVGDSPLHAIMSTNGATTLSVRARAFIDAVERICVSYQSTTASTRPNWYQHEFRAVCQSAVPVAGELSALALTCPDAIPVSLSSMLDALACHVSKQTKDKLQKLQLITRMVVKSHAAPSSCATAGTPANQRPLEMDFPASPAAALAASNGSGRESVGGVGKRGRAAIAGGSDTMPPPMNPMDLASAGPQPPQPPAASESGFRTPTTVAEPHDVPLSCAASTTAHAAGGSAGDGKCGDLPLFHADDGKKPTKTGSTVTAPNAADNNNTKPSANTAAARDMSMEKLTVIMPWKIPPPYEHGAVLRPVNPKTFKAPQATASGSTAPSTQDLVAAASSPDVYAMWLRREAAVNPVDCSNTHHHSHQQQQNGGAVAGVASTTTAAAPAPIFPHVAAHNSGVLGPSGIGDETTAARMKRHITVRRSLLTALAHFGVHWVQKGSATRPPPASGEGHNESAPSPSSANTKAGENTAKSE